MEFLFENPLIIFILIGIISSLFKKKNGDEQQRQRPARKVPSQREERAETFENNHETMSPVYGEAAPQASKEPVTFSQSENEKSDIQKKYEEWKQYEAEANHKEEAQPSVIKKTEIQSREKVSLQLKPDADRLIEGIAWAQVLGKPRAKNPHRTMRR